MTKKLIAMLLCVMMVASVITIPAFADEISYADYVPGAKPENMLRDVSEMASVSTWWSHVGTTADSNGKVARAQTNGYKGTSITAKGEPGGEMVGTSGQWYQIDAGLYIGQALIKTNHPEGREGDLDDGKNYVYALQVKNLDTTYTPKIRFMLYDLDGPAPLDSKEWGSAGMPVTSTDWMDYKGSIKAPERNKKDTVNDVDRLNLGFNASTVAGSSVEINFTADDNGMYPMYFAEEAAYDIENVLTSAAAVVTTKNSASFKAQILNQVGLPGYLDQSAFEWKAMDTARTAEIPGITVIADGAVATVTVDETVAEGQYDIVAYNSTYKMAKGYTITVTTPSEYLDYEPGAMPANMFKTDAEVRTEGTQGYSAYGFIGNVAGSVSNSDPIVSRVGYTKGVGFKANGTPGEVMTGSAAPYYYLNGIYFGQNLIKGNNKKTGTDDILNGDIAGGKNYVYSIQIRNKNTAYTPKVAVLLYDLDAVGYSQYAKEYGSAGMTVSSADWVDLKGTIKSADDSHKTHDGNNVDRFSVGFPSGTLAGSEVELNCTDASEGMHLPYLAEEAIYDISNELAEGSSDTINCRGEAIVLKAQLLNQVGLPGYLDQGTFTWKALDVVTRKNEIEGIKIALSDDTATATVTVDSTVEAGEYAIVAKNGDMAKGFVITVEEPNYYEDYEIGEMPANMLRDPASGTFAANVAQSCGGTGTAAMVSRGNASDGKIAITANGTPGEAMSGNGPAYYLTKGLYFGSKVIATNNESGIEGDIADNKNYVFSIQVRNVNPEITPNVHVLLYDLDGPSANYTKEHGSAGMAVTSTDWMDFKGTITNPDRSKVDTVNDVDRLSIGFPGGTLAGSSVEFNFTNESEGMRRVYFAEEQVYNITNTLTAGTATLADGQEAAFAAEVVNQIGVPGNMKQNIEWRVMNKARTSDANGFVITEGENGAVTVQVNGAEPGTYDVVAYSADYKMARGIEITVAAATEEVTLLTTDGDEYTETLFAAEVQNTTAKRIMFAIASYNTTTKKMVDVAMREVDVEDGVATFSGELAVSKAGADKVRIFVWDADGYRPIAFADGVEY